MEVSGTLQPNTTLVIGELSATSKKIVLTENATSYENGRLIYIKASPLNFGTSPPPFTIECSTNVQIYPGLTSRTLNEYECVTLLEQPTNTYNLLNYYTGTISETNFDNPSGVAVNIPGGKSCIFVNVLSQSKTLVLPPIQSLTAAREQAPYFMIKDIYGNAATNNLYISTMGNATIDGFDTCLKLTSNGCAIELIGDYFLNRWHILNYYDGTV